MKATTLMSDRQCRQAENRMRSAAAAGGITDDGKLLVNQEKCYSASGAFFNAWTFNRGGKFNEIITLDQFTREEIRAILLSL